MLAPQLRRWWVKKYKLPWTHKTAQDQTYFDLLVEYYEDYFEEDKTALYNEVTDEHGHTLMPETGDELIDKWERELAAGIKPDLEEGYTQEQRKGLKKQRGKSVKDRVAAKSLDGINENYDLGNLEVLGREEKAPSDLSEFAKAGGLKGMDPVTVKRIVDKLTPTQAQEIMAIISKQ